MMVSFIIPAHNEQTLLPRTLESIHGSAKALKNLSYEVIVADDASTDATADVARQHNAKVVRVDHRQISRTRNSGAAGATGEVLVFIDADTMINEAVLRGMHAKLTNGAVGGGAAITFDGKLPLYGRILMPIFAFCYRHAGLAAGCFVYCTRRVFEAVGGFDEDLYAGEEVFFSRAVKKHGRFVVLKQPVVTSGRKLRTYSFWEILRLLTGFILGGGMRSMKCRDRLGLWYDPRRADKDT